MAKGASTKVTIDALQAENARLKTELTTLRRASEPQPANEEKTRSVAVIVRKVSAILSLAAAVVLLVFGNLFFWAGNTLVKPDRFVAATSPVIQDQQVQQALSLYTTNKIFSNVDVQQGIEQVLPPRASFLAPQLTDQLRGVTQRTLKKALATPKFQNIWNNIIAKQHERIIRFAEAYQGSGAITLHDLYARLAANLKDTKLAFLTDKQLPQNIGSYTIITSAWLPTLHALVTNIDTWRTLSILGFIILAGLSVWLSRNRRRTLYALGLFATFGLAVSLLALRIVRERLIDKVDPQYMDGVARALQIIFHGLVIQTLIIMTALLLMTAIAWISGDSHGAPQTKRHIRALTKKLHALIFSRENRFTAWISRHRQLLEWGVVVLFTVIMLSVRITPNVLIVGIILMVLLVACIEILSGHIRLTAGDKELTR